MINRLQKFEGNITSQGKLLLYGPMMCVEGASNADRNSSMALKPRELQIFLFEQNIIFAEILGKKTQFTDPTYIYKNHIQVCVEVATETGHSGSIKQQLITKLSLGLGQQNENGGIARESAASAIEWSAAARLELHHRDTVERTAPRVDGHDHRHSAAATKSADGHPKPNTISKQ